MYDIKRINPHSFIIQIDVLRDFYEYNAFMFLSLNLRRILECLENFLDKDFEFVDVNSPASVCIQSLQDFILWIEERRASSQFL